MNVIQQCDKYFFYSDVSEELRPVAGAPVIKQLSKQRGEDGQHKVLICEAEGSPKPAVSWSINGTSVCTNSHTHLLSIIPHNNYMKFVL